ncbi:hypothetical protein AB5J62_15725 [Amycolatopsis sp. cg5]|uniref:hypothetical protein n=1 Tax=Amycolatopsis sp. cg5 TaxID=3238802 RepID=UPI00352317D4
MRHRGVAAVAAVAVLGLSGCADRPNDLDTYYDDPAPAAKPSAPAPKPPAPSSSLLPPPKPNPATFPGLTDDDLSDEGVHRVANKPVTGCLAELPEGTTKDEHWQYSSGASLVQRVTHYGSGADVLKDFTCDGQERTIPKVARASAQRVSCEGDTCTVLVAWQPYVLGLQVTASTPTRALDTAKRLAPILGEKIR